MKTLLALLLLTLLLALPLTNWLTKEITEIIVKPAEVSYKAPKLAELPVEGKIRRIFGSEATIALAVFTAESRLRCDAVSATGDYGPAQINRIHSWRGDIKDCMENIKIAKQIYEEQGWRPWMAWQNKSYLKFLK